jgi:hypothetical protein
MKKKILKKSIMVGCLVLMLVVSFTTLAHVTIIPISSISVEQAPYYNSVQIRVQINTSTPWSTSANAALGKEIHIGVFKNGWGVPIDQGGVSVYAVQGSKYELISLSVWEAWWKPAVQLENDKWTFVVYYGSMNDQASATWGKQIDVLSYVLPNWPQSVTGTTYTVVTNRGNYWRTYSNPGGDVGERLPGFFITKGGIDWEWCNDNPCPPNYDKIMWYFEEMIYDSEWIYLVRDTSWDKKCEPPGTKHICGQLLFTYDWGSAQWLRGGKHFPRFLANGGHKVADSKYVQGVERRENMADTTAKEGMWCKAENSGWTESTIYAELIGTRTLNGRTFNDVLKIKIIGGSGEGDRWLFAKGYGLIQFRNSILNEKYAQWTNYPVTVRIPCYPGLPCM